MNCSYKKQIVLIGYEDVVANISNKINQLINYPNIEFIKLPIRYHDDLLMVVIKQLLNLESIDHIILCIRPNNGTFRSVDKLLYDRVKKLFGNTYMVMADKILVRDYEWLFFDNTCELVSVEDLNFTKNYDYHKTIHEFCVENIINPTQNEMIQLNYYSRKYDQHDRPKYSLGKYIYCIISKLWNSTLFTKSIILITLPLLFILSTKVPPPIMQYSGIYAMIIFYTFITDNDRSVYIYESYDKLLGITGILTYSSYSRIMLKKIDKVDKKIMIEDTIYYRDGNKFFEGKLYGNKFVEGKFYFNDGQLMCNYP